MTFVSRLQKQKPLTPTSNYFNVELMNIPQITNITPSGWFIGVVIEVFYRQGMIVA